MNSEKNSSRIAGVLFITATVAGILSAVFMGGILEAPDVNLLNQVLISLLSGY